MEGRGHQKPALAFLRIDQLFGEKGVLIGIARAVLEKRLAFGHAELAPQPARDIRLLGRIVDQRAGAAGKDQQGLGIEPRQRRALGHALGRVVERDLIAGAGDAARPPRRRAR